MPDGGATARALELAYRYLSRRERTVHEVRQHLIGRDVDGTQVQAVVAELIDTGYLDDARYARMFTQDKRALEQWGSGRIRRALLARGVDGELIDCALRENDRVSNRTTPDELGQALALLERRFPRPPGDRRERQRAMGVLIRRGYDPELASDAIAAYSRPDG